MEKILFLAYKFTSLLFGCLNIGLYEHNPSLAGCRLVFLVPATMPLFVGGIVVWNATSAAIDFVGVVDAFVAFVYNIAKVVNYQVLRATRAPRLYANGCIKLHAT